MAQSILCEIEWLKRKKKSFRINIISVPVIIAQYTSLADFYFHSLRFEVVGCFKNI